MASLFTSESVTEGHPDKLADQISDAILDAILAKDPLARVACEAIVTTGLVIVVGEITTDCYVDIPRIIRQTVREVGYTRAKYGFDAETCGVVTSIDEQSPDIAQGVDVGGAGDSGMMFGFACDDTPELMPMPITLAHRLARKLAAVSQARTQPKSIEPGRTARDTWRRTSWPPAWHRNAKFRSRMRSAWSSRWRSASTRSGQAGFPMPPSPRRSPSFST